MKNDNHKWDNKLPTAQMLGRWQPWHEGHSALFKKALLHASKIASNNKLVVLGLKSTEPNQNYGYITYNKASNNSKGFEVKEFIEKPSLATAKSLIKKKALWNSGIVIVKNAYLIELFEKYSSRLFSLSEKCFNETFEEMGFTIIKSKTWDKISPISFLET